MPEHAGQEKQGRQHRAAVAAVTAVRTTAAQQGEGASSRGGQWHAEVNGASAKHSSEAQTSRSPSETKVSASVCPSALSAVS